MKLDEKQLVIIAIAVGVVAVIMSCAAIGIAVSNGNDDSPVTVFDWKVNSVTQDLTKPNVYVADLVVHGIGTGGVHVYSADGSDLGSFTVYQGMASYHVRLHHPQDLPITVNSIIGIK